MPQEKNKTVRYINNDAPSPIFQFRKYPNKKESALVLVDTLLAVR